MKTVGILTYHHYYNYGTMLQALALQRAINDRGYQSEIIDYQQDTSLTRIEQLKLRIRRIPAYIVQFDKYRTLARSNGYQRQKKYYFEEFYNQHIVVGNKRYTKTEELLEDKPRYDGYVVGSDQTWNPYVSNRPEAFYLTFVDDNKKKGSYAPSLPVTDLTAEQEEYIQKHLSKFAYLSCREKTGAMVLERILQRDVINVIDPTLLLNGDEWAEYEERYNQRKETDYILAYFLGDNKKHREIVRYIQNKTGYKVISIPMSYMEMKSEIWERAITGPSGFLDLIHHAKIICTDSFHGTMFSINFHKQFYSFCKMKDSETASNNSRIYDSLSLFGLEDRVIQEKTDIDRICAIDYKKVDPLLEAERKKAFCYLEEMLRNLTA